MENYSNNSNSVTNDNRNQQEQSDANTANEPIVSGVQPIPTFGVGGQTSHVVDPEFRQPAPTSTVPSLLFEPSPRGLFGSNFYAQQPQPPASNVTSYTSTSSNIYSSSNLFVTTPTTTSFSSTFSSSSSPSNDIYNNTSIPRTMQPGTNSNTGSSVPQLSFTMNPSATSFSDLARRNNPTTSDSGIQISAASTSTASMLQEYGPPPSTSPIKNTTQSVSDNSNAFGTANRQNYNISNSITSSSIVTTSSSTTTSAHTPYIPPTSDQTNHPSSHAPTNISKTVPAYSPPQAKPKSPPLDKVPGIVRSAGEVVLESMQNKSSSSKIPKRADTSSSSDLYESMDLISLQKEYRRLEGEKVHIQRKRVEVEKVLNDLTRSTQGKNIELSPLFRSKREEQKKFNNRSTEIEENMRRVSDRLHTKFSHRIEPRVVPRSNPIKRAKMSTAAPAPRLDSRNSQFRDAKSKKLLFDFVDSKTWCETCDCHFESVKEFCYHLHHRDHARALKTSVSVPWRSKLDPIDRRRTYEQIKSICSRVSSEMGQTFSTTDLEKALLPNFEKENRKERCVGRERSRFGSDDELFTMKGYNYLVPVTGYYCKLCSRCLCDYIDVEQHLKGHEHTYKHTESIALNPSHEKKFRTKMERSYRSKYSEEIDEDEKNQSTAKKATTTSVAEHDGFRIPQYKKKTSHIVDEHEAVADKFTNRPERASKSTASKSESDSVTGRESPSKVKSKRTFDTEIVPLGETRRPTALKRLRNEATSAHSTLNKSKKEEDRVVSTKARSLDPSRLSPDEIIIVSDDEGSVNGADNTDTLLDSGDPDNPFPELELRVLGNHSANILKDPRLAAPCNVVLAKLDLEAHQEYLNDAATLWARVHKMLAKKEKGDKDKVPRANIRGKRTAEPVYFNANDELVPIDCDEIDEKSKPLGTVKEEKPKISKLSDSGARANASHNSKDDNDLTKKKDGNLEDNDQDKNKGKGNVDKNNKVEYQNLSDSDESDTPRSDVNLSFLTKFFCEE